MRVLGAIVGTQSLLVRTREANLAKESIYPATAFAHARKPKCVYWRCPTLERAILRGAAALSYSGSPDWAVFQNTGGIWGSR
jgi:hypothetical protein